MFTTTCYVRGVMTESLQSSLTEMGYHVLTSLFNLAGPYECYIVAYENGNEGCVAPCDLDVHIAPGCIDCGDNVEMFLALAALRDDSDFMQWFCDDTRTVFDICRKQKYDGIFRHKMSAEEIVEHFKNKG